MLRTPLIRFYQFREHYRESGFLSAVKLTFYKCERVCPVEKDLSSFEGGIKTFDGTDYRIIELDENNFENLNYRYSLKSRYERAGQYFKQGFKTFVLVKGQDIIGDVWYVNKANSRMQCIHPRVKWFGIQMGPDDVYMFDLYMKPNERGGALTTTFMAGVLKLLKDKGFTKAYGDYVVTNIPALWIHRMLGYKEMPVFVVKRYFIYEVGSPGISR
ncbi:MAG: hypothetical protein IH613_04905 [Desulfuromonadales bacterium]|nr:hypothetical protein [Desulfuromonadales bacterium]